MDRSSLSWVSLLAAADEIHHFKTHHDVALLIQHLDERADDAAVRLRLGASRFEHGDADRKLVAGKDRLVPPKFVTARRAHVGDARQIMVRVEAHHKARGVPAARDKAAVDALLR